MLAQCEAGDTAKCGMEAPAAKEGETDPNATTSAATPNEVASPVPEPETFIMLMLGLVVLGVASRRSQLADKFLKD